MSAKGNPGTHGPTGGVSGPGGAPHGWHCACLFCLAGHRG